MFITSDSVLYNDFFSLSALSLFPSLFKRIAFKLDRLL